MRSLGSGEADTGQSKGFPPGHQIRPTAEKRPGGCREVAEFRRGSVELTGLHGRPAGEMGPGRPRSIAQPNTVWEHAASVQKLVGFDSKSKAVWMVLLKTFHCFVESGSVATGRVSVEIVALPAYRCQWNTKHARGLLGEIE